MRVDVRARKCVHVYNRIKTGEREKTVLLSTQAFITTFLRVLKWFRTGPEMSTAYMTCTDKNAVENS